VSTALVTGATAGIGYSFAHALASRGHDLVLVSRDSARLEQTGSELRQRYRIEAHVLPADLSVRADVERVEQRLSDRDQPVDVLINNAGFALNKAFASSDVADEQRLLDVLVTAVMRLSHAAVPGMLARGSGQIVNVSSVAGFLPFGTYSAAKAYVTVFSQGLNHEVSRAGVRVLALCPGYVHTEFHARANLSPKAPGWLWLDADDVVAQALRDLARGKTISVPSTQYKLIAGATHLVPRSTLPRLEQIRRRQRRR
jgi:short-subunit dehydrogenase